MSDFDQLQSKWSQQNQGPEYSELELLTWIRFRPVQSMFKREASSTCWEAGFWLLIVIALGSFISEYFRVPALAISGLAADLMSIGMFIALIRRALLASSIDYRQQITFLQQQMETLRLLRIRTTLFGVLFGALLWVPWLAVAAEWMFRINIYTGLRPTWLVANALFGIALFPAAVFASKKSQTRFAISPLFQRLLRDLAGSNLSAAQASLDAIRAFEKE